MNKKIPCHWTCPDCFYQCDTISSPETDKDPIEGDVTYCLNCGAMFYFTSFGDGKAEVRRILPIELAVLPEGDAEHLHHIAQEIKRRGRFWPSVT